MQQDIAREIKALELELISPIARRSPERLDQLLSDDFAEVGSSGNVYDKNEVIQSLCSGPVPSYQLFGFTFAELSHDCVLITYIAKVAGQSSHRCSVWVHSEDGWKLRYHQSTPIVDAVS